MFTRGFLAEVRRKALRNKTWWRALDRVDRAFFDLTIRVVDRVRSAELGVEIVKVLKKLSDALKSRFVRLMESYGLERARSLSKQAQSWGYGGAGSWRHDFGFVRFLTVIKLNSPGGFG